MASRPKLHSESAANLLGDLGRYSASFSECALKSLAKLPDFDSTMRRFESSRPGPAVLFAVVFDHLGTKSGVFDRALRDGRGSAISGMLRYGRWSGRTGDN
jgi:hypothetical protein